MGPTALLSLRRKACWGFFRPKNPTASAGCEPANLDTKGQNATSRPPKPLWPHTCSVLHFLCSISRGSQWICFVFWTVFTLFFPDFISLCLTFLLIPLPTMADRTFFIPDLTFCIPHFNFLLLYRTSFWSSVFLFLKINCICVDWMQLAERRVL